MPIREELTSQRIPVKIWTDDADANSKRQLENIASLPNAEFLAWHRAEVFKEPARE